MKTARIKNTLYSSGIKHYELCKEMGISTDTLSRMFREEEITGEKLERVLAAIDRLKKKRNIEAEETAESLKLETQIEKLNDRVHTLETIVDKIFNSHALQKDREDELRKSWKGAQ